MKKGFTLVELLAVILILGIVAIFAMPIIGDVLNDSKENANLRSIEGYARSIKQEYYNQSMEGKTPVIDETFLSNVDKSGGDIACESIKYSDDYGVIMYKCKFSNTDKEYCYAKEKHYACDDSEFLGIYEWQSSPQSRSFAEDSWETIAENVKNGNATVYNVGDTKEVTLTGDWAGTYTVRIANNSTPTECSNEGFSQTACGFVVEFVDVIARNNMNETSSNFGGWPASKMYNFLNTDIYNILPVDLQNIIISTYSVSGHGNRETSNFISNDKVYLLSAKEVWGKDGANNVINNDSAETETRQLDYYKNSGVTTDLYSGAVKTYQGSAHEWWLWTAWLSSANGFCSVKTDGNWEFYESYPLFGVSPSFRIG